MKAFEYAAPVDEWEVLELLDREPGKTEILAGGTDLIGLMKSMIITPERVVNIKNVDTLRGIHPDRISMGIGAAVTLDELLECAEMDEFPSIKQAIRGINSPQIQAQGTLGGELCQRPRCWYFRNGHGLLAGGGRMVSEGDNRYHAIFGNAGAARFVHASRLAPALVALDAVVRVIGPGAQDESIMPLADFFRTPRHDAQRENVLEPGQLLTHVLLPRAGALNATYEVRHGEGPDYPLVAAAAAVKLAGGVVQQAKVVLGHVAPIPWVSTAASEMLLGRPIDAQAAREAGQAAVASATPLSQNRYKVRLTRVAVERAILLAAGLETGGF